MPPTSIVALVMENTAQKEITFYQDASVQVTQSRFITKSKTYAMRNISSVHIFEIVKSRRFPIILIAFGLALLFSDAARVVGFIAIALGALILALTKNEFAVRISTNAGEVNSIISKDKSYIQNIVNALNDAIVHTG